MTFIHYVYEDFIKQEWFWTMAALFFTIFFTSRQYRMTVNQLEEQKREEKERNTPKLKISYQTDAFKECVISFIITNINYIPVTITGVEVFLNDRLIAQYKENYRYSGKENDRLKGGEIFVSQEQSWNDRLPFFFMPDETYLKRGERGVFWFKTVPSKKGNEDDTITLIILEEGISIDKAKLKIIVTDSIGGKHESEVFDFGEIFYQAVGVQ